MFKMLLKTFVTMLLSQLLVESLREQDFRKSLDGYYQKYFSYALLHGQIKHRIDYLTEINQRYPFTTEEVLFINTTIESMKLLSNFIPRILSTIETDSKYEILAKIYNGMVEQFNNEFSSKYKSIVEIDFLSPTISLNLLDDNSETVESIKQNVLYLIDSYSYDINLLLKNRAQEGTRAELSRFCLDNLTSLRSEIENFSQVSGSLSFKRFKALLRRFDLIVLIATG